MNLAKRPDSPIVVSRRQNVGPRDNRDLSRDWIRDLANPLVIERGIALLDIKALEGSIVTGLFYPLDPVRLHQVKLHKVEQYGVWIESQFLTNKFLATANAVSSPKTGRTCVV
jgi:hypothetical protein